VAWQSRPDLVKDLVFAGEILGVFFTRDLWVPFLASISAGTISSITFPFAPDLVGFRGLYLERRRTCLTLFLD
jgi:hypothetical protein